MITNPEKTPRKPVIITRRDEQILREIYQYRYMTALDVAWLLFKPTSKTHVLEILSRLAGGKDTQTHAHLYRFGLPSHGNPERVFTLGAKGRRFLAECGLPKKGYFYPYKTNHISHRHLEHSLLLTRCIVCANVWTRQQTGFNLLQVRFGYEFRRAPVVPDAWLLFERVSNSNRLPIFLEIDRGREYQKQFKEHLCSRIKFIEDGSYTRMFGSRSVTIAYATTGEIPEYRDRRRRTMAQWTKEVLVDLHKENWTDIFRFTCIERESLFDLALFDKPVWYRPDSPTPRTLLTP
jgi:hypothetical protein